ncbi:hypothetical protein KQ313_04895 [Synechococcus sp. CS-1325]|nr:hypothetical protein [Synechococcus sp. CS-1325]
MVVIDQFSQVTGIRADETFFEPLQLYLKLADLLEQLSLLGEPGLELGTVGALLAHGWELHSGAMLRFRG